MGFLIAMILLSLGIGIITISLGIGLGGNIKKVKTSRTIVVVGQFFFFSGIFFLFCLLASKICHIHPTQSYNWFSGIWHGIFVIPNWIVSWFSDDVYFKAVNATNNYYVCWWISFILIWLGILESVRLNILAKFSIYYYKKQIIKSLNETGFPQNATDWMVRNKTCKILIEKLQLTKVKKKMYDQNATKWKIEALEIIANESLHISKIIESESLQNKLNDYSEFEGFEDYVQIGGNEFAKRVLIYNNKSKIIVKMENIYFNLI
jgi:hypothetical protein